MRLPFRPLDGLCRVCGREAVGATGEYLCEDCRAKRPSFDRAAAVFRFEGDARDIINKFKFKARLEWRDDFVDALEATARARFRVGDVDVLSPIPSTLTHRFLRGFNPTAVLSRPLSKRLDLPHATLLRRCGHPARQGGLSREARLENVRGTFEATRAAHQLVARTTKPLTALLLDDIMTTGSTLSEAAKTLKAAGFSRVFTLALAHPL